jgi:transposase
MRERVPDDQWRLIRSFLPVQPPRPQGGRPRVPDRDALAGILFVLRTGIAWEHLPQRFGCGSGMTCWRRLREWQQAGVWPKIRHVLEGAIDDADGIDWGRAWVRAVRSRPARRAAVHGHSPRRPSTRSTARQPAAEQPRPSWGWNRSEPA